MLSSEGTTEPAPIATASAISGVPRGLLSCCPLVLTLKLKRWAIIRHPSGIPCGRWVPKS